MTNYRIRFQCALTAFARQGVAFVATLAIVPAVAASRAPVLPDATWAKLLVPERSDDRTVAGTFGEGLSPARYGQDWLIVRRHTETNDFVGVGLDDALSAEGALWIIQMTGEDVPLEARDISIQHVANEGSCIGRPNGASRGVSARSDAVRVTHAGGTADRLLRARGGASDVADETGIQWGRARHGDSVDGSSSARLQRAGLQHAGGSRHGRLLRVADEVGSECGPPPVDAAGACMGAPALPPVAVSDPGKTVVEIASESELQAAIDSLMDNTVLLLQPGTYALSRTLWIKNDNVTIRGASARCGAVELVGRGMENASGGDRVPHGIWTESAGLKVQNLTIRDVYYHPIVINGSGDSPEIYNVQLLDAGQQFVKANPLGFADGVDNGRVEYSIMEYTAGPPKTDRGGGTGYSNGVDVHGGRGWVIRHNLFRNFHTPDTAQNRWNPAILMWNGAAETLVENNRFVDVDRAVAFGLLDRQNDHSGGTIRNNMIVVRKGLLSADRRADSDAQILVWSSPGTAVLHNTILTQGNMYRSIELRFDSHGSTVMNNLVDAPIGDRSSNVFRQASNVSGIDASLFREPSEGDLHLVSDAPGITDAVPYSGAAPADVDGTPRPRGSLVDAGADER